MEEPSSKGIRLRHLSRNMGFAIDSLLLATHKKFGRSRAPIKYWKIFS
jgi:hypothetical protein